MKSNKVKTYDLNNYAVEVFKEDYLAYLASHHKDRNISDSEAYKIANKYVKNYLKGFSNVQLENMLLLCLQNRKFSETCVEMLPNDWNSKAELKTQMIDVLTYWLTFKN